MFRIMNEVRSEKIKKEPGKSVTQKIEEQQLRCFEHVLKTKDNKTM